MDVLRITSLQNPRIKAAMRLRDRSARREQQRILIDGEREIRVAHSEGVQLLEVFYNPARCDPELLRTLMQGSGRESNTTFIEVPDAPLEKLCFGSRNEGIIVVAAPLQRSLERLQVRAKNKDAPLVLVLEDLEKPGNIGAIVRTASAAGIDGLVAIGDSADLENPNAIRASLGTVFSVPCCTSTVAETQSWIREMGLKICAAKVDADVTHFDFDFTRPTAIILGSEATGLSSAWSGQDVQSVRIPLRGAADSLNVSVAAAVLVYEAMRQRNVKGL